MSWVDDNKGAGPWAFTERGNVFGYLNNPLWSTQQDAIDFCEDQGLVLDQSDQHDPCGHWHKAEVTEEPFPAGKWVAAMQQPGTPFIYVYDILQKAVIRIDTSEIPVFVSSRLELDSAYTLDYDMGWGNPGAQRGGYCMNKDATRIWYFFNESDGNRVDAELIEVDISKTNMLKVKFTHFTNLLAAGATPGTREKINDGCSDDTYTYWCTDLVAGRIIKIQNSDHSIIDDHTFNYPIEGCSLGSFDNPIATIDYDRYNKKLYWVYTRDHAGCVPFYNACQHLIRADVDFVADIEEVVCGIGFKTPGWQNMVRIYSNHILHQQGYHPFSSPLYKRTLGLSKENVVAGTALGQWVCIKEHIAALSNRPITGADYATYWSGWDQQVGGNVWQAGKTYHDIVVHQEYLQNVFGIKDEKIFTLMHLSSISHPAFLYCIDFSGMEEISKLDVSYYAGQRYPAPYDWDWTSVSAMNYQTGVIAIFRYNNVEERNYVGCFDAKPTLDFLCDVPLYVIRHASSPEILNEPQVWPCGDFVSPDIPEADPLVSVISDPGPGEIIYEPPLLPPDDVPDDGVTLLQSGFTDRMME
jgi:hypothetical protein